MELCVALDMPSKEENLALLQTIREHDLWIKVGLRSFVRDGREFLEQIKQINPNFRLFLDLKLHDIPNTMADAAQEIAALGVDLITLHASAGKEAMLHVMERLSQIPDRPKVLAVTVLTSMDAPTCEAIYQTPLEEKAHLFARDAFGSGLDGIVCSVHESSAIKAMTHPEFITLTPGIRPFGDAGDDQKRVADIPMAKAALSDIIVVGRPIYKAENPAQAVNSIINML